MLFRIEDVENIYGQHRVYNIPFQNLPKMKGRELPYYLAEEIRKEINNAKNRKLLSYSKSLGVGLLKYNKYTDNELHINTNTFCNYVGLYLEKNNQWLYETVPFDLMDSLREWESVYGERDVWLHNFQIDVSNNNMLNDYLLSLTGKGRKKVASPEKDKEVLLFQSPNDTIISEYLDAVYLLYALFWKYGMNYSIYDALANEISNLEAYRFENCGESERYGVLQVIHYLYAYGAIEKQMSMKILQGNMEKEHISMYYDSILQFQGIQREGIEDSYLLSDYNSNVVSDKILNCYYRRIKNGYLYF